MALSELTHGSLERDLRFPIELVACLNFTCLSQAGKARRKAPDSLWVGPCFAFEASQGTGTPALSTTGCTVFDGSAFECFHSCLGKRTLAQNSPRGPSQNSSGWVVLPALNS